MGRFIAEPLGEQPIGSEGSSRPALRTYLLGYILREPQSTSANWLGDVGEWGGWRLGLCSHGVVLRSGMSMRAAAASV